MIKGEALKAAEIAAKYVRASVDHLAGAGGQGEGDAKCGGCGGGLM